MPYSDEMEDMHICRAAIRVSTEPGDGLPVVQFVWGALARAGRLLKKFYKKPQCLDELDEPPVNLYANAEPWAKEVLDAAEALVVDGEVPDEIAPLGDMHKAWIGLEDRLQKRELQFVSRLLGEPICGSPQEPIGDEEYTRMDYESFELVQSHLFLSLLAEHVYRVKDAADRVWDLARMVVQARPPTIVRTHLQSAARCYLSGSNNECVIWCRSALETAFSDVFTDEVCARVLEMPKSNRREGEKFVMAERIDVARKIREQEGRGLLEIFCKQAHDVRERANKALHCGECSVSQASAKESLERTLSVLKGMFPANHNSSSSDGVGGNPLSGGNQ